MLNTCCLALADEEFDFRFLCLANARTQYSIHNSIGKVYQCNRRMMWRPRARPIPPPCWKFFFIHLVKLITSMPSHAFGRSLVLGPSLPDTPRAPPAGTRRPRGGRFKKAKRVGRKVGNQMASLEVLFNGPWV